MPASVVKTAQDEADWERAKAIVAKQYPDKAKSAESDGPEKDSFYALVMTVYKSILKGRDKTESLDADNIRAALVLLQRPSGPSSDALEIKTESAKLKPGDRVVVVTKTGRTMASGTVYEASDAQVTLTMEQGRHRTFPSDLYSFLKVVVRDDQSMPDIEEDEDADVSDMRPRIVNTPDMSNMGPLPIDHSGSRDAATQAVEFIFGILGDRRLAHEVFTDMTSRGSEWAAYRHRIPADTMNKIVAILRSEDLISSSIGPVQGDRPPESVRLVSDNYYSPAEV